MDQPAATTLTSLDDLDAARVESWPRRIWREYVTDVRATTNARASVTKATDRRMAIVFVTAAISLTLGNFLSDGGHPAWLASILRGVGLHGVADRLNDAMLVSVHRDWNQLAFWAVVVIATYLVPSILVIKLVFRERVRDFGLSVKGIPRHLGVYALLFSIVLPFIFAASFTASFQQRYPFFHPAAGHSLWPYMFGWWALYWLQFCALEFFFRGFLLNGLVPRLGYASIFAMALPYNMLHYGKPMPEALAAIVGGIVLGTLALKTRSIWLGAALHISIALSMDLFALWHLGRVF